jgi:hypothetical protein
MQGRAALALGRTLFGPALPGVRVYQHAVGGGSLAAMAGEGASWRGGKSKSKGKGEKANVSGPKSTCQQSKELRVGNAGPALRLFYSS